MLVFFAFLAGIAIFNHNDTVYPRDDLGLYAYHSDQCERPVDRSWMAEVENTLSNAGYVLAGALILLRAGSWAGLMYGANLVVLGAMSALYHATLGHGVPQIVDVAWVYAALLSLSTYASYVLMQRPEPLKIPLLWLLISGGLFVALGIVVTIMFGMGGLIPFIVLSLVVAGFGVLCFIGEKVLSTFVWITVPFLALAIPILGIFIKAEFGWDSDAVFAIMVVLLIIQLMLVITGAEKVDGLQLGWQLPLIVVLLGLGLLFRLGDGYKSETQADGTQVVTQHFLCGPDWAVQPHALWHLIGGAALLMAYDLLTRFQPSGRTPIDRPLIFPDAAGAKA
ncbi:MAG: hypothetical protein JF616_00245 [Fibrobacteres bacterium]|nr:hypothetical protein [Fibrobacterota bacterium]